jgi:DNA-binding response OmpR family regulator
VTVADRRAVVLVIDDDEDVRELLRYLLERAGYAVRTAVHGRDGLDSVADTMPDLILLDLKMPVMDGKAFAAEFLSRYGRATPIVVVTAADDARKRAAEIGAADWLAKPFEADGLTRVVAAHLPAVDAGVGSGRR